ncbi:MAG: hypothetical protein DRQ60_09820 [Gammaproteobacteria bacterium]|nr:MAG: hypothetical protein DRQ60_09820 [Gammaproteobacteria bacterium]
MAFKSAYDRLCNLSLLHSKPIAWKVSIGYDKDQIKPVVEQAVIAGRLTRKQAVKSIPAPKDAGPIAGLLTGKVVNINSKSNKKIKTHLLGIKKQLSDIDKKQRSEELARQEEEIKKQNEFDEKKREAEILLMRKDLSK